MPYLLETVRDQWMSDQDVDHSQEMGYTLNRILMNDAEPQMNESEHFPNSPTMK